MAYIRKYRDKWRAEVERNGVRKSQLFPTKTAAQQWAAGEETKLLKEAKTGRRDISFKEALLRYVNEVSVNKRGKRFEELRIQAFIRDFPSLAKKQITDVETPDFVTWRDARLKVVSRGTVLRDLKLFSNFFIIALNEWKLMDANPLIGLRRPRDNPPRKRLVNWREIKLVCRSLGYVSNKQPVLKIQEVALAFLIALRTGMRAGEVLQLNQTTVDFKTSIALVSHKMEYITGSLRVVPMQRQALRLIKLIPKDGFTVSSASLDALFRKTTSRLLIEDLHFHDSRATALTRLTKKVDVMTLAKISGHKDLNILLNTYYRETAEDIARRL